MVDVVNVAGLTFAAVEIAKQSGLSNRYAGIASLVFGALIALLVGYNDPTVAFDPPDHILTGVIAGLSAAGVYSGARAATRSGEQAPPDRAGTKGGR